MKKKWLQRATSEVQNESAFVSQKVHRETCMTFIHHQSRLLPNAVSWEAVQEEFEGVLVRRACSTNYLRKRSKNNKYFDMKKKLQI